MVRTAASTTAAAVLAVACLAALLSGCSAGNTCQDPSGNSCPCGPGCEFCGNPFTSAPKFHLMDQHGCGENDPNGPSFDPVHGVIHHFYQIHLAAPPGHGPDYGHFVSKDFVHWAALPVAIWNGLDSSTTPPAVTKYDNEAIFTGSGIIMDGAGPGGKGPGLVQIYPGLCNKQDWPACSTGTLLAQAVPANYADDELLVNWTKPSYNPIVESTQRDPSTPWQTPSGEWRLRTYDSKIYGTASAADMLAGKWYEIGTSKDLRTCECPSLYPLPAATPGFEAQYEAARRSSTGLPSHVHKTSCGGDWWQLGNYVAGAPRQLGSFGAAPGWEDVFAQKRIDPGNFYASKDNTYPTAAGGSRRINWGWATVPPASTQTLPREITFNAAARTLQQYPIAEIESLRSAVLANRSAVSVAAGHPVQLGLASGAAKHSELLVTFDLPAEAATFGVHVGDPGSGGSVVAKTYMAKTDMPGNDYNITHHPAGTDPKVCEAACDADAKCLAWTYVVRGKPAGSGDCCLKNAVPCPVTGSGAAPSCTSGAKKATPVAGCSSSGGVSCTVDYDPAIPVDSSGLRNLTVQCGSAKDVLRLLPTETSVDLRIFADATFVEAYFQRGRVAITASAGMGASTDLALTSTADVTASRVETFSMESIWVSPEEVRAAPRVYPSQF